MRKERIEELVEFFYSSNSSKKVPCRLSLTFGMGGADLTKDGLRDLLYILSFSLNIKKDLQNLMDNWGE